MGHMGIICQLPTVRFLIAKIFNTPYIRLHAACEKMVKCYIAFAFPKKDLSVLSGGHDTSTKKMKFLSAALSEP
jgi:hypothetical protein